MSLTVGSDRPLHSVTCYFPICFTVEQIKTTSRCHNSISLATFLSLSSWKFAVHLCSSYSACSRFQIGCIDIFNIFLVWRIWEMVYGRHVWRRLLIFPILSTGQLYASDFPIMIFNLFSLFFWWRNFVLDFMRQQLSNQPTPQLLFRDAASTSVSDIVFSVLNDLDLVSGVWTESFESGLLR